MTSIGVVLPSSGNEGLCSILKERFWLNKLPVLEYNIEFIAVSDRSNYVKIFKKKNIKHLVSLSHKPVRGNFIILDGQSVFKRMLPSYMRKLVKSSGSTITIADKNISRECEFIAEELCRVCSTLWISTENKKNGEILCEKLLEKYGVVINVIENDEALTDIVAILEDWNEKYGTSCGIIYNKDKNSEIIKDFYLPFSLKPPFNMANTVFAECVEIAGK